MKKTILTIMVAAMMLVAFTACEQQVPDLNGQVPTNAIITQTGTFVEGQMFDPTQFSVKLTYKNGYTETVSGANLVTLDSEDAYVVPGDTVSVNVTTIGGTSNGQQMIGQAQLNVKTIESVTVVAPESVNEGADINSMAVKSLFTVTVNYDGGTIAVKPSEFKIVNLTTTSADTDPENPANDSVTIDVYLASGTKVASSDAFSVVVVDPDAPAPEDPEFTWTGNLAYAVTPASELSSGLAYIERGTFDESMITVYKEMADQDSNKKYEELTLGSNETLSITLTNKLSRTEEDDIRFDESGKASISIVYIYVDDDEFGKILTVGNDKIVGVVSFSDTNPDGTVSGTAKTVEITGLVDDYVIDYDINWLGKNHDGKQTAYDEGENITATDFEIAYTWRSGCDVAKTVSGTVTVAPNKAPSLENDNSNYPVTVKLPITRTYIDQPASFEAEVNVAVNADPDWEDPNA